MIRNVEEAIQQACEIRSLVYHTIGDYSLPSDGFCLECPARRSEGWNFQDAGQVTDYIRQAVVEKLTRDGYSIADGFDPVTGKFDPASR